MSWPKGFEWIDDLPKPLPKMITAGYLCLGIQEIKGKASNPEIMKMAKEIGAEKIYQNDDTSWCAVSHNAIALRAGKKIGGHKDLYDILRALAFLQNGLIINKDDWEIIEFEDAMFGDTMVFSRPEGGHLGILIGESKTHYYIMGGNQNNMYSITRVAKNRLVGVRRPKYKVATPPSVAKYYLDNNGAPETSNEK